MGMDHFNRYFALEIPQVPELDRNHSQKPRGLSLRRRARSQPAALLWHRPREIPPHLRLGQQTRPVTHNDQTMLAWEKNGFFVVDIFADASARATAVGDTVEEELVFELR